MRKMEIFDFLGAMRDSWTEFYTATEDKRKAEIKVVEQQYTPRYIPEQRRQINDKYNRLIEDRRHKMQMELDEALIKERAKVTGSISRIPSDSLKIFDFLDKICPTQREFDVLIEQYGNKNPWVDRRLEILADENNLDIKGKLNPSADMILEALDDLEERGKTFLENFGDDTKLYQTSRSLHPGQLYQIEDRLVNRGTDPGFSPKQKAQRALTAVSRAGSVIEQARRLRNALNTADDTERRYILSMIDEGKHPRIYDDAIRLTSVLDDVEMMKQTGSLDALRKADAAAETVRQKGADSFTKESATALIASAGGKDNPDLLPMLQQVGIGAGFLKDAVTAEYSTSDPYGDARKAIQAEYSGSGTE